MEPQIEQKHVIKAEPTYVREGSTVAYMLASGLIIPVVFGLIALMFIFEL